MVWSFCVECDYQLNMLRVIMLPLKVLLFLSFFFFFLQSFFRLVNLSCFITKIFFFKFCVFFWGFVLLVLFGGDTLVSQEASDLLGGECERRHRMGSIDLQFVIFLLQLAES